MRNVQNNKKISIFEGSFLTQNNNDIYYFKNFIPKTIQKKSLKKIKQTYDKKDQALFGSMLDITSDFEELNKLKTAKTISFSYFFDNDDKPSIHSVELNDFEAILDYALTLDKNKKKINKIDNGENDLKKGNYLYYLRSGHDELATKFYLKSSENGNVLASMQLAKMYFTGYGVKKINMKH